MAIRDQREKLEEDKKELAKQIENGQSEPQK
jgi:hypothetical protein